MAHSTRPAVLAAIASYLEQNACARDVVDAMALGIEAILIGHGISIDRTRPDEDPAADWQSERAAGAPPDLTGLRHRITAAQRQWNGTRYADSPEPVDLDARIADARRRFENADAAAMDDEPQP